MLQEVKVASMFINISHFKIEQALCDLNKFTENCKILSDSGLNIDHLLIVLPVILFCFIIF